VHAPAVGNGDEKLAADFPDGYLDRAGLALGIRVLHGIRDRLADAELDDRHLGVGCARIARHLRDRIAQRSDAFRFCLCGYAHVRLQPLISGCPV